MIRDIRESHDVFWHKVKLMNKITSRPKIFSSTEKFLNDDFFLLRVFVQILQKCFEELVFVLNV